ncbi:MAG: hypothetical protein A2V67_02685 [Deltaproteobacteria bacterium RBG_13_61_14]|nr:MAG: hypothetical protein A2V67_02685 [Deltaproteobacteria bacterium RBG_13_61_14]
MKATAAGGAALAFGGIGGKAWSSGRLRDRPNLLLVLDDQERQPMHTPALALPNRDRLKPQAVEFTRAYCTYPLCSPSRATLMTGRYPHQVGVLTNVDFAAKNPSLSTRAPTLGRVFSEAGYTTAYFGKWHLSRRAHTFGTLRRYGFDSPHVSNQLIAFHSDPRVTENAGRWIRKSKDRAPWLLVYSPINPHDICFPGLSRRYPGDKNYPVSLPANYESPAAPGIRTLAGLHNSAVVKSLLPDESGWLDFLRFYCYLIEDVDRNLGVVLDALEESGQWENTVKVFTSDHGEMGGSHGLMGKSPTMYEENLRIPLWISDPRPGQGFRQCDGLVSNLDLAPTLCAAAGVRWPEPLPGRDLTPVLRGEEGIAREHLFCEGGGDPKRFGWRGLCSREWKYWHYLNGEELLFNVQEDPLELHNLAGDHGAADVLSAWRERVREWRRETKDPFSEFLG